jgi:hypothetical protein
MNLKFSVDLNDLRKATRFASNALGSKGDFASQMFLFGVESQEVTIFSANQELFALARIPATGVSGLEEGHTFEVLGEKIGSLTRISGAEKIAFAVDSESAEIHAGYLKLNLPADYGLKALMQILEGAQASKPKKSGQMPTSMLLEALECAKACTGMALTTMSKVNHTEFRDGRFLASDGSKVMIYEPTDAPKDVTVRIANTILGHVASAVKAMDAETVTLAEAESYYYIYCGSKYCLGVRTLEKPFNHCEKTIFDMRDGGSDDDIVIDLGLLQNMIQEVSIGLDANQVKVDFIVSGADNTAEVTIRSENRQHRESVNHGRCGRQGTEEICLPISFVHLLNTLSVYEGDQNVDIAILQSKHSTIMIKDKTPTRVVYTTIPLRTPRMGEAERAELAAKAVDSVVVESVTGGPVEPAKRPATFYLDQPAKFPMPVGGKQPATSVIEETTPAEPE